VEWLDGDGRALASSDFSARRKYLEFVARHRAPCIAEHWDYLLRPFVLEYPGQVGTLRYRQLEYYRMPFMAYLALDDPKQLTRADWVRLGLVTRPGGAHDLPYSAATLGDFESRYCDDRFWGRDGERASRDLRVVVTGQTISMVGAHGDPFFAGLENGLLSQFRHQYFLLFLIGHFHKAAMLSISDELAVAMNRLVVGDTESVKAFKRTIRQMMEVFLRLTVVTILGLIGTVATGFLGMNLISAAERCRTSGCHGASRRARCCARSADDGTAGPLSGCRARVHFAPRWTSLRPLRWSVRTACRTYRPATSARGCTAIRFASKCTSAGRSTFIPAG
jgi:hypothetical protein